MKQSTTIFNMSEEMQELNKTADTANTQA